MSWRFDSWQDYAVRLWHDLGAPFDKLVLGIGTYGRGFTLSDASNTGLYAPASQPSPAGPYTREAGILGYNEVSQHDLSVRAIFTLKAGPASLDGLIDVE